MSKTIDNLLVKIDGLVKSGDLTNADLVQIIELCGDYLNLKSITDYARDNQMSYNGVKKFRKIILLFNHKFVVDNE